MSAASDLAISYKIQEKALLVEWRSNFRFDKNGNRFRDSSLRTSRFERKIRSIYPRGRIGLDIKGKLAYHTV